MTELNSLLSGVKPVFHIGTDFFFCAFETEILFTPALILLGLSIKFISVLQKYLFDIIEGLI